MKKKNRHFSAAALLDGHGRSLSALAAGFLATQLALAPASAQLLERPDVRPKSLLGFLEQKVTPSDGMANSFFGSAVAIAGSHAIIGADGDASFRGSAYLYSETDGLWTEGQKLTPSDGLAGDEFGYRVALQGRTAVVTAFSATVNGVVAQGSAYVYVGTGTQLVESQKLLASDGGLFDDFGASVAIDRDTLVIGANGATVGNNPAQGAVYVFVRANGVWSELQKLVAADGAAFDNFGISVAVQDGTIMVGSSQAAINGNGAQGAVYVFTSDNGSFQQTQKLTAADGAGGDSFGISLALDRDTALIGAYGATVNGHPGQGAAYSFAKVEDSWTESQKLFAEDGGSFFNFGNNVALHGHKAAIAADVTTVNGHTSQGKVYVYIRPGADWTLEDTLVSSDGTTDDFFGAALALGQHTILVGTPHPTINGNSWEGAAYFYRYTPGGDSE